MIGTMDNREVVAGASATTMEEPRSPATPAPRRLRLSRVRLLQLVSVVVLLGVWQLLSMQTTPLTLPSPVPVLVAVVRLVISWEFWGSLLVSVQSLAIGYAVSVVVGLVVGIVVGLLPRGPGAILDVYLYIGLAVPIAGLIPVIVIALGVGLTARVMVVVLFAVTQVAINVSTGVREADRSLVEMAHSFGAAGPTVFRRIVLPGAMPSIMAGMRLGLGRAIVGTVTSELILLSVGIGKMVVKFSSSFQTAYLIAYLLLIVVFGVLMMAAVQRLERRLTGSYRR